MKQLHYIHFGDKPLSELNKRCIASWKKFAHDYEIKLWNEDNFNVSVCDYCRQAYEAKAYAHCSDYARLWIVYNHGGIYFDTDVELIRPLVSLPETFFAIEAAQGKNLQIATGLGFGAEKGNEIVRRNMEAYHNMKFEKGGFNSPCPAVTTHCLNKMGYYFPDSKHIHEWKGATFFPKEYFCPMDYMNGEINITDNTLAIHHYACSWGDAK